VLRRINKLLVQKRLPGFVTLFLAVLDSDTGMLRYSSAGHPESLLRRASGEVEVLPSGSTPLGVFPDGTWKPRSAELDAGDLLVMYTDGIIEARRDGDFFGEDRLAELTRMVGVPVERLPEVVLSEVLAFSGGTLKDDVALLAVSLADETARGIRHSYRQETLLH
jgi:serine phosphatase RsbU (regulator of sigma subunit)